MFLLPSSSSLLGQINHTGLVKGEKSDYPPSKVSKGKYKKEEEEEEEGKASRSASLDHITTIVMFTNGSVLCSYERMMMISSSLQGLARPIVARTTNLPFLLGDFDLFSPLTAIPTHSNHSSSSPTSCTKWTTIARTIAGWKRSSIRPPLSFFF